MSTIFTENVASETMVSKSIVEELGQNNNFILLKLVNKHLDWYAFLPLWAEKISKPLLILVDMYIPEMKDWNFCLFWLMLQAEAFVSLGLLAVDTLHLQSPCYRQVEWALTAFAEAAGWFGYQQSFGIQA